VRLRDTFLKELAEVLTVERTLADEILPELLEQTQNKHFREAIEQHITETRQHAANVERAFAQLGDKPAAEPSHGLEGLRRQHDEAVAGLDSSPLRDHVNAGSAAHTEHYEIAAYHSLINTAELLGEPEVVRLFEQNLHQEEVALEKLEKSIPEKLSEELLRPRTG
jgi:ferritin-like metal-binding protein YciE